MTIEANKKIGSLPEQKPELLVLPYMPLSPGISAYTPPEGINFTNDKEARIKEVKKLMKLYANNKEIAQTLHLVPTTVLKTMLEIFDNQNQKLKEYKREIAYQSILQRQEEIDKLLFERKLSLRAIAVTVGVSRQTLPEFLNKYMGENWVLKYEEETNNYLSPEKKERICLELLFRFKECFSLDEIYELSSDILGKERIERLVSEKLGPDFLSSYQNFLSQKDSDCWNELKESFQKKLELLINRKKNIILTWELIKEDVGQSFSPDEIQEKYFIDPSFFTYLTENFILNQTKIKRILRKPAFKECPITPVDPKIEELIAKNYPFVKIAALSHHSPSTISNYIKTYKGEDFYQNYISGQKNKSILQKHLENWGKIEEEIVKGTSLIQITNKYHIGSKNLRLLIKMQLGPKFLEDYKKKESERKKQRMAKISEQRTRLKHLLGVDKIPQLINSEETTKYANLMNFLAKHTPSFFEDIFKENISGANLDEINEKYKKDFTLNDVNLVSTFIKKNEYLSHNFFQKLSPTTIKLLTSLIDKKKSNQQNPAPEKTLTKVFSETAKPSAKRIDLETLVIPEPEPVSTPEIIIDSPEDSYYDEIYQKLQKVLYQNPYNKYKVTSIEDLIDAIGISSIEDIQKTLQDYCSKISLEDYISQLKSQEDLYEGRMWRKEKAVKQEKNEIDKIHKKYFVPQQENLLTAEEFKKVQSQFNPICKSEEKNQKHFLPKYIVDYTCHLILCTVNKDENTKEKIIEIVQQLINIQDKLHKNEEVESQLNRQLDDFNDLAINIQKYFDNIKNNASQETIDNYFKTIKERSHKLYEPLVKRMFPQFFPKK